MNKIEKILETSLDTGTLLRKDHDAILMNIHSDGQIDSAEKQVLSKLFNAIQSGKIELVDNENAAIPKTREQSNMLGSIRQSAIERDSQEKLKKEKILQEKPTSITKAQINIDTSEPKVEIIDDSDTKTVAQLEPLSPQQENSFEALFGKAVSSRKNGEAFQLKNDRLLDVCLNGKIWMKAGSMAAYFGMIKFTREGIFEHGIKKLMAKSTTGEGATLTKASGQGNLYLADQGKKISIISLGGHSLVVNGSSLLAFEETIEWDIVFLKQLAAIWKGGLFNVRLNGEGAAAITTTGDPLMLRVRPEEPIMTDMSATVAWSGSLAPQFKTDIALKSLVGRTSGDSVQMKFQGDGFVIIQPFEEAPATE